MRGGSLSPVFHQPLEASCPSWDHLPDSRKPLAHTRADEEDNCERETNMVPYRDPSSLSQLPSSQCLEMLLAHVSDRLGKDAIEHLL